MTVDDDLLLELENYVRDVWSLSPTPMIYIDTKGVLIDVNDSFLKTFNLVKLRVIDKSIFNLIPELKPFFNRLLSNRLINQELSVKTKNGLLTFIVSAKNHNGPNGKLAGFFISMVDISLQKLNEQLIRAEKLKLDTIISSIGDGLFFIDKRRIITRFNHSSEVITGFKASEVIGKRYDKVLKFIFSDTGKRNDFIEQALKTGKTTSMGGNTLLRTKSGSFINVADSAAVVNDSNGLLSGVVVVFRDETKRVKAENDLRKSEEMYRNLFDKASELIQVISPDKKLLYANNSWFKVMGYSDKELSSLKFTDFIRPDLRAHCVKLFNEVISKGINSTRVETVFLTKDGREVFVEGSINFTIDKDDNPLIWSICNDVTDLKAVEKLRAEHDKAVAVNNLKNQFFMRVSHELRHPLVPIVGYSSVMLDENPSDIQRKYLEKILQNANQLKDLINNIIDVSTLETGEARLNLRLINLKKLVNKVLDDFKTSVMLKNLKLIKHFKGNPVLLIDEKRFIKALSAVLDNAVKFTNKGKIIVSLIADKSLVKLIIEDSGVGLSKEELLNLKNNLLSNDLKTKKYTNLKLGLLSATLIVKAHDGNLLIDSVKGKGTKVTILLPIRKVVK